MNTTVVSYSLFLYAFVKIIERKGFLFFRSYKVKPCWFKSPVRFFSACFAFALFNETLLSKFLFTTHWFLRKMRGFEDPRFPVKSVLVEKLNQDVHSFSPAQTSLIVNRIGSPIHFCWVFSQKTEISTFLMMFYPLQNTKFCKRRTELVDFISRRT